MHVLRFRRVATAAVLASAAMVVTAPPASAAAVELEAGQACDFGLGLDGGAFPPERRNLTDRNGNDVTVLAGRSGAVTWTNLETGKAVTFPSRGTALKVTTISPTSQVLEFSGHVGLALFPTDRPAGPSTTQITGRLVLRVDPTTGFTEVVTQRGHEVDVCAALS